MLNVQSIMSVIASLNVEVKIEKYADIFKSMDCPLLHICTTFHKSGSVEPFHKSVIACYDCETMVGIVIDMYNTEALAISEWVKLIFEMKTTHITSWNLFNFDYKRLIKKSKKLGIYEEFEKLGSIDKIQNNFWIKDNIIAVDLIEFCRRRKTMVGRLYDIMKHYNLDVSLLNGNYGDIEHSVNICIIQNNLFNILNVIDEIDVIEETTVMRRDMMNEAIAFLEQYDDILLGVEI